MDNQEIDPYFGQKYGVNPQNTTKETIERLCSLPPDENPEIDFEAFEKTIQRYMDVKAYLSQPVTGEWLEELGAGRSYEDGDLVSFYFPSFSETRVNYLTKHNKLFLGSLSTPAKTRQQVIHVLDLFNIPYNKPEIQ